MDQAEKYYAHSGSFDPTGPIYMIVFGAMGAIVLSLIYGYAINYIPFIYLNFFITLGFGAGVGLITGFGGKLGKVRNTKILLTLGLCLGIFAEYAGWVSWIFSLSKQEVLVFIPTHLLRNIQVFADNGVWSIFGWTPKGFALYLIWAIEALMIIGASALLTWSVIGFTPFCERCGKWIDKTDTVFPLQPLDKPEDFKNKLEQGDFSPFKELQRIETGAPNYSELELLHCPDCKESYFFTIKCVVVVEDKEGKETKTETTIMENFILSAENFQFFKNTLLA